ncbi:hypothetical protein CTI12_AA615050 [Artemisia annua]|uniref:Uncharacterized protein n=1 Tax=Artemisia annua TaxID=35608 RepID=A0A2U1KE30_ARTAN|nr:hypothetical protein CTI12_AA615050 [Artemisia annua]
MEVIAITIIVFMSVAIALTVLVTLLNKRGAACDPEAHPNRIHKRSSKAGHIESGMSADSGMAAENAAVAIKRIEAKPFASSSTGDDWEQMIMVPNTSEKQ